jgi:hypothetical protein
MIHTIAEAVAGHAGETGVPGMMPHEVMGGIAVLIVLGVMLVILAVVGVWLLFRIDRRLHKDR